LQNGQYAFEDTLGQLETANQQRDGSAAAMAIDGADGQAATSNGRTTEGVKDINTTAANEHGQPTNPSSASSSHEARAGQPSAVGAEQIANNAETQEWEDPGEPDAEELRGMTAFDGGVDQFKARLGKLATAHWDRINTVKEGEPIINFAYAVRMRSECCLHSVPAFVGS
jgi:hypothetical protein